MKLRLSTCSVAIFAVLASAGIAVAQAPSGQRSTPCNKDADAFAPAVPALEKQDGGPSDAYKVAYNYLVTFYPRWFTYYQSSFGPCNSAAGPNRVTALYQYVVAINNDTLYASSFVTVKDEPVIVTIPAVPLSPGTYTSFSVLQLDLYGNVFSGIPSKTPGLYALTSPGWSGTLPAGATRVNVSLDYSVIIFRADKYVGKEDAQPEAAAFRENLHVASLSDYNADSSSGAVTILPQVAFALPFKTIAVVEIANHPLAFLRQLQKSVHAGTTAPLTADQQALSDSFDSYFAEHKFDPIFAAAAQAAHADVDANYYAHKLSGAQWINFTNIGMWTNTPQGYLDRSSITDYIQFGNNYAAAAYYHSFTDGTGAILDGSRHSYTLTFKAGEQPDVSRFWSLTAYLPLSIELVPNSANKYLVASYTPGLVTADDGSVTIYMSVKQPAGVPAANWLPIPRAPFNILLRAYGPLGSVEAQTYVPPAVVAH